MNWRIGCLSNVKPLASEGKMTSRTDCGDNDAATKSHELKSPAFLLRHPSPLRSKKKCFSHAFLNLPLGTIVARQQNSTQAE